MPAGSSLSFEMCSYFLALIFSVYSNSPSSFSVSLLIYSCIKPYSNKSYLVPCPCILICCQLKYMRATGYPYNLEFDYGALGQLQHFSINNLGDPFIESNYGVHSRQFEVGVLDWFARLWELEKNEYWGYITNCGTEGNLHGILVGSVVLLLHLRILLY